MCLVVTVLIDNNDLEVTTYSRFVVNTGEGLSVFVFPYRHFSLWHAPSQCAFNLQYKLLKNKGPVMSFPGTQIRKLVRNIARHGGHFQGLQAR